MPGYWGIMKSSITATIVATENQWGDNTKVE